jgi:8-oxo-dGTP diphosphatase
MDGKLCNLTSVYISSKQNMLMLYRIGSKVVDPSWCGIGGHFEKYELNDARACVLRELYEEMKIPESALENLSLRYITLRLKQGEIRQNYFFFADLKPTIDVELLCNEGKPEWVAYDDILKREMPYTAKYVLNHYFRVGKYTTSVYGGIATETALDFIELEEF